MGATIELTLFGGDAKDLSGTAAYPLCHPTYAWLCLPGYAYPAAGSTYPAILIRLLAMLTRLLAVRTSTVSYIGR